MLRRLVSTCIARDIEIWSAAQSRIPACIEAQEYLLICPARDIEVFRRRTSGSWSVRADEEFCSSYDLQQIRQKAVGKAKPRAGWLLQQFLKMNACADVVLNDRDLTLIWDADTLPLRPLQFVDAEGRVLYRRSVEYHAPYFATLNKLLGPGNRSDSSFIAQCFPARVRWTRELMTALRDAESGSYVETVMNAITGCHDSEFSEYETMGTWNWRHHHDEMAFVQQRWSRGGARFLGHRAGGIAGEMMLRLLAFRYDYVAVENWQRSYLQSIVAAVGQIEHVLQRAPRDVASEVLEP